MPFTVLSIQSHVAAGHVGDDADASQRLGIKVQPLHPMLFDNRSGYDAWTGHAFDGPLVRLSIDGPHTRAYFQPPDRALAVSPSISPLYALLRGTELRMPREPNQIALQMHQHARPRRSWRGCCDR